MEKDKKILKEMQNTCRYKTYLQNEEREEWFREYQAIGNILNKLEELEKENKELKEMYKNTGTLARNKKSGRVGIILREWETGQIQVCEGFNNEGYMLINTHDSWETLQLLEEN